MPKRLEMKEVLIENEEQKIGWVCVKKGVLTYIYSALRKYSFQLIFFTFCYVKLL